jgi:hypothetical protein
VGHIVGVWRLVKKPVAAFNDKVGAESLDSSSFETSLALESRPGLEKPSSVSLSS